jgi:hypothetical protein
MSEFPHGAKPWSHSDWDEQSGTRAQRRSCRSVSIRRDTDFVTQAITNGMTTLDAWCQFHAHDAATALAATPDSYRKRDAAV